jgi:hypothetical protein
LPITNMARAFLAGLGPSWSRYFNTSALGAACR